MKKILILATAMVLLAILLVPMAAFADPAVSGTISAPTISVTPPGDIGFGTLKIGDNYAGYSTGSVAVTDYGSANNVNWQVVAQDNWDSAWGHMKLNGNSTSLINALYLSGDNGVNWYQAYSGGPLLTYTGTNNSNFYLWAYQLVSSSDAVGYYYTYITFTGTITSYT